MDWQYKLIETYLFVSESFENGLSEHAERMSNNRRPRFSDQEVITIYLFGIMQGHFQIKAIYQYTLDHMSEWFPALPSYQTYCLRLGRLWTSFIALTERLSQCRIEAIDPQTKLADSLPVILANSQRSSRAKVAPEYADKGRCSTKIMWYYGVKIHVVATRSGIPLPDAIGLSPASANDLSVMRPLFARMRHCRLFADKIFWDQPLKEHLKTEQDVELHIPIKLKKGQRFLRSDHQLYSKAVSRLRQPIESLFNWIQQKTGIQTASKVRSGNGLLVHVFGKLAAAMFMLVFNY